MNKRLKEILLGFDRITLSEMDAVSLMKRTDTKYVFPKSHLPQIISKLSHKYKLLHVNDVCNNRYNTLYYDTPDLKFFYQHQNGKLNRYKVRSRMYLESKTFFLEVKFKNNKGKTIKTRVEKNSIEETLSKSSIEFINKKQQLLGLDLVAKQWNDFSRLTMVGKEIQERVTIDYGLNFKNDATCFSIPELVIVEIKQEKYNVASPFIQSLRQNKIRPMRFSKYCIGTILLNQSTESQKNKMLKWNRFKPKIRTVKKIQDGTY